MSKLTVFLLPLYLAAGLSAHSVTGNIEKNTTWRPFQNPVIVTKNVEVAESTSLTIEAGVVIKFDGNYHLLVKGILEARGTAENPIEFTSNRETPAQDDWDGIVFYGEKSGGYLRHCKIRYAFKNLIWKSAPTVENCVFNFNNYALYCSFSKTVKIVGNEISSNNFGIYCDFSSPVIQKNKIVKNRYGIYCILSSAPMVGENEIASNSEKDIYLDESMGKNQSENINNHVWDLMKGLF